MNIQGSYRKRTDRGSRASIVPLDGDVEGRDRVNMQQGSRQQGAASAAPRARVSCWVMDLKSRPENFQNGSDVSRGDRQREQHCYAAPKAWTSRSTTGERR